jgi:hypothetical protein
MKFVVKAASRSIENFWFIVFFLLYGISVFTLNNFVKVDNLGLFVFFVLFLILFLPLFSYLNKKTGEGIMEWTLSENGLDMKWIKTDIITDNEAVNLDWKEIDRIQSTAITSIGYGKELGENLIITTISGKTIKIRHLEKTKDDFFAFKNNLYSFNKKNNK